MSEDVILKQALDTYGIYNQIMVMFEELSELQKALCKFFRNDLSDIDNDQLEMLVLNLAEEVADVEIMLTQIKNLFDFYEQVYAYRKRKIKRLAKRLNMEGCYD